MTQWWVSLACLVVFATSPVSAQTAPTGTALPAWVLAAVTKAEAMMTHDDPTALGCPIGTSYLPIFTPGRGLRYECRPIAVKDTTADRLAYLNSWLIVMDSTLTGYLVWTGVGEELNPLMRPFFVKDKPWLVGVKGALGTAQTIAIYRLTRPKSKWRYVSLGLAITINAYACVNNYLVYMDHQRNMGMGKGGQ